MQVANAQFNVNLVVAEPDCFGLPTGSIAANVSGGAGPFSYIWSTGATGATLSNIFAGGYSVTVTDSGGASVVQSTTVGQPTVVAVNLSANTCLVPFVITATGTGGNPPYNYAWSTGATGSAITVPLAGTYCVTMTDQNLCGAVNCITVNFNPLDVSVAANGLTCPDSDDGEVQATATGGTPPFAYSWSNGATTAAQTGLPAGTYTVTVTDAAGCSDSASGTVSAPPPLTSNVVGAGPGCAGGNNGSAMASANGGTPPYGFAWSTGANTAVIAGLAAGTYTVTITDANGCDIVDMISLAPVSNLQAMASATPESCPGANDGTATATAVSGVPPYIYLWSNGETTQTITGLAPATYTVTIIDGAGCTAMATAEVTAAPPLEISLSSTDVTTCDVADGTATVDILQGLAPLAISWSNGESTAMIAGLAGGTYGVTVTDANGCTETGTVAITQPPNVSASVTATPAACPGEATGMAIAVVSGGTMPFSFTWNTGGTGPVINNLPAGTYTVVVVDANGCQAMASATIAESPPLQATVDGTETVCGPGNTGAATATAIGGTPPYSYEWSNGENTESIDGLTEGTYTITITDANGCMAIADFTVDVVDDFMVNVVGRDVLCNGGNTGSILLVPSGGTAPYVYNWNTGATTNEITGLSAGTYSVTVAEAGGCTVEKTITINEPPALNLSVSGTNATCPGANDGAASASASGGAPPYAYSWSNGAITANIGPLSPGTYSVTATDANLCEASGSVTIAEPPQLQGSIATFDALCAGDANGSAMATVSGGTPPYTYAWSAGGNGQAINGLAAGSYSLSVSDANGCMLVLDFSIAEPAALSITATTGVGATCDNATDGAATVFANGGTPPYRYSWSNGANTSSISNLPAGAYSVTVTDANGCTAQASVAISAFDSPSCSIAITREITSAGNDGEAQANVSGGTAPFSYLWSNGQNSATAANLAPGSYSVVVTDANGCETSCDITLAPSAVCVNITDPGVIGYDQFLCGPGNDPDEIVDVVTPSGGVGAIEYLWMKSTIEGPFNMQTWMPISGADGPSYDPPALYETTYFARCVRRENCTLYQESNIVTIEVGDVANAQITAPDFLCVGEPTTILAGPTGTGAVLSWEVYGDATPLSGAGPSFTITAMSSGIVTVVLYVSENGCDASNFVNLTATASPLYCSGQNRTMPINVNVVSEEEGKVMVSWMMEEALAPGLGFTVEYSEDGVHFEALGEMNTPLAYLGSMNYYEFAHLSTKRGRNFYRIQIQSQYGETFFSEIGEAILYNDSEVALLYPNPATNRIVLELFENFGQEVQVEIFSANGARMSSRTFWEDTQRAEFDLSDYPSGVYFFNLRYSKSGVKVLKVLKR